MGQNVVPPGKYSAVFTKRICATSLNFSQSHRISCSRVPCGVETGRKPVATTLNLATPAEINLAKRLCQFSRARSQAKVLNDFRPNILANYLFEVANGFHTFYEACPVLKSDEPARSSRLALCDLTGRVLHCGLDLLGIKVPEKM